MTARRFSQNLRAAIRSFPVLHAAGTFSSVALLVVAWAAIAAGETIYEVNTTGATQTGSKNNSGVYIGQSFNSGPNTLLKSATLEINRNDLGVANFTLSLHAVTGSANNYYKTGDALASATFSNADLSENLGSFFTFNNLNWAMSPSTVYMIGIGSTSPATVKWTLNQSGTKDSSTGFITGYTGYNSQEGNNVDNGLHGATITAVPEPAGVAVSLAALFGAGATIWRRRLRA